jgi:pimeloyl-ACP methyl ester carboxylesterase
MSPAILDRFDIIGFDPRGVGASTEVDCVDSFATLDQQVVSPRTPVEKAHLVDAAIAFGDACQRRSGALIQHINTEAAARDMDLLRAALGEDKISYLGYSCGTFLGAMYADLFPQRVRAAVLDGAEDPAVTGHDFVVQQVQGFESALAAFFTDCSKRVECGFNAPGRNLPAEFDALMLASTPHHSPATGSLSQATR